jgi:hypothetical protein
MESMINFSANHQRQNVKLLDITMLVVAVVLAIGGAFGIKNLKTEYSVEQFFPAKDARLKVDQQIKNIFNISDQQPFMVLVSKKEAWTDKASLNKLKQLTEKISKVGGVKRVLSLTNLQGARVEQGGISVGPLIESYDSAKIQKELPRNPLLTPTFISKDFKTVSLIVEANSDKEAVYRKIYTQLIGLKKELGSNYNLEIAGTPVFQLEIKKILNEEIVRFVGIGLVLILIAFAFIFQNASPLIILFYLLVAGNLAAIGSLSLFGIPFSILSTTLPILVSISIFSLFLHTCYRLAEDPGKTDETLKEIFLPNLITSVIASIGFLCLATTNIPLISQYGYAVCAGVISSWMIFSLSMPALLKLLPPIRLRSWSRDNARWALYLFPYSKQIISVTACIFVLCLGFGFNLHWTGRLFDDLPQKHPLTKATQKIDTKMGGIVPIELEIIAPENTWIKSGPYAQLDKLLKKLRLHKNIEFAMGLPDVVSASNLMETKTQKRNVASTNQISEILFLYSMSEEDPSKNFLNQNHARTRISLRVTDLPAQQVIELVNQLKHQVQTVFPSYTIRAAGLGATVPEINKKISQELIFGFWQSLLVITIILAFIFRSLRWALVACIPNLIPPALLLGAIGMSGTAVKPGLAITFSIALGLAFNNTVYLLQRMKRSKSLAVKKTMWVEGNPCLFSSLVVILGFGVFLFSSFEINQQFGLFMIFSVLGGILGDLILLPTLLHVFPGLLKREKI